MYDKDDYHEWDEWDDNDAEPIPFDSNRRKNRNKKPKRGNFLKNILNRDTEEAQTLDIIISSISVVASTSFWLSSASGSVIALTYILPKIDSAIMITPKLPFPAPFNVAIGVALITTLFLAMEIATVILQWQEIKSKNLLDKYKSRGDQEKIDELRQEIKLWKTLTYIFTAVHWMLMASFMTHFTVSNGEGFDPYSWSSPTDFLTTSDPFFKAPEELNLLGLFQITLAVGLGFVISASSMILFPKWMADSIASLKKAFRRD